MTQMEQEIVDFDFFEKLSELETNIHFLKMDISTKDEYIRKLEDQNCYLRHRIESLRGDRKVQVKQTFDKETSTSDITEEIPNCFDNSADKSIAEILKETSENAMQKTGYVFDQRTGLYFDKISGYYYDPENQLFFEPRSGVYYSYNSETHEYSYHSKISSELSSKFEELVSKGRRFFDQPDQKEQERRHRSPNDDTRRQIGTFSTSRRNSRQDCYDRSRRYHSRSGSSDRRKRYRRSISRRSFSGSDPDSHASSPYRLHRRRPSPRLSRQRPNYPSNSPPARRADRNSPPSKHDSPTIACVAASAVIYPPSVRLMVISSNVLSAGVVGIITSKQATSGWGCLGRNVNYCPSLNLMDDADLEEIHCEISFRSSDDTYLIKDRNTRTGTFINGQLVDRSEWKPLCHGDVLRIGSSRILVHIHQGSETCGQCEPEACQATLQVTNEPVQQPAPESTIPIEASISCEDIRDSVSNADKSMESLRRAKLSELKSKYGIRGVCGKVSNNDRQSYRDRAAGRRAMEKRIHGSSVPLQDERPVNTSNSSGASVFTPIADENVGARLLSKMGWSRGEGLGKEKSGRSEPISVDMRINPRACLGSSSNVASLDATPREIRQARYMATTRERYRRIDFN